MPCGIEVGAAGFTVPAAGEVQRAPIEFDTVDYDETRKRTKFELRADLLSWQSLHGAAGVSSLRARDALRAPSAQAARTKIDPPEARFTAVEPQGLKVIAGIADDLALARSPTLLAQRARVQGKTALVLETFETLVAGG
jgi:hypothetical protein